MITDLKDRDDIPADIKQYIKQIERKNTQLTKRLQDKMKSPILQNKDGIYDNLSSQDTVFDEIITGENFNWRLFFDEAPIAIHMVRDSITLYANPYFLDLFGYSDLDDIIGLHESEFIHKDYQSEVVDRGMRRQTGEILPQHNEIMAKRKDGSYFHARTAATQTILAPKSVVLAYIIDISDRIKVEREKQELQSQLYQMQKMKSLGLLASGISHDLKNILSVIYGNISIVKSLIQEDSTIAKPIDNIEDATTQATELTGQLQAYAGETEIEKSIVDLNDIINDLRRVLNMAIKEELELKFDLIEDLPRVKIDPTQFKQVLLNLVVNASDAISGEGEINISTSTTTHLSPDRCSIIYQPEDKNQHQVVVNIADTGPGISQEKIEKIFDPFYTTKSKGRGLGLSVVFGIIKNHNASLCVETGIGEGTTFEITFSGVDDLNH